MAPKGWITLTIILLLATTLAGAPLSQAQDEEPALEVTEILPDPETDQIGPTTEEVSFNATIENNDDYTGDFSVTFVVNDSTVAEVDDSWALLDQGDTRTIDSREDPDGGNWTPTIGSHTVNVTVYHEDGHALDWLELDIDLGPDLEPSQLTVDPEEPVEGDTVEVDATIENNGTWAMPQDEPVNVTLVASDPNTDQATVQDLDPGASTTVTLTWTAEPGDQTLVIRIEEEIAEIHTDNNEATVDVHVEEANPQVAITNLAVAPNPGEPGDSVGVQATLHNPGNAEAPETTTRLLLNGEEHEETTTEPIEAGGQTLEVWQIHPDVGIHEVTVQADATHEVTSPPDDDLTASQDLTVGPNLVPTTVDVTPGEPVGGDDVTFEVTIDNHGSDVTNDIYVALFLDGSVVDDTNVDGIAQGATGTATLGPWSAIQGNHTFTLHVDPEESISEAATGDNEATVSLDVEPAPPDIQLQGTRLTTAHVDPGDSVAFETTVANRGDLAAEDLLLRFHLDDTLLSETDLGTLSPGDVQTVTSQNWTAEAGSHALSVTVGTQEELDDDAPRDRATETIAIGPNLEPTHVRIEPTPIRLGDTVTVNTTVENKGTQQAGAFQVDLALDDTLDEATVQNLSPRSATYVEHEWHVDEDADALTIIVDSRGDVDEVDETNNQLRDNVTVDTTVAHLVAADLTPDPENPEPGDNVTFKVNILNQGAADAGTFEVMFLIEDEPHSVHTVGQLSREDNRTVTSEPWQAEEGVVNVTAIADHAGIIPQSTREDNEATLTMDVQEDRLIPGPSLGPVLASLAALLARRQRER